MPLGALLVPAAHCLACHGARRARALLEVALVDAKALGLQEDVLREGWATLCLVLLVVDGGEEVGRDLLVSVILHVPPVLTVEGGAGRRVDLTVPLLPAEPCVEPCRLMPVFNRNATPSPVVIVALLA